MYRAAQIRLISTSTSSFPFPTHRHPTPHQIFHLSPGASQKDIKSRYYDLVRIHHPDSPFCRNLSPAIRRARFQSIATAYASLTNKAGSLPHIGLQEELIKRRKAQEARRRYYYNRRNAEFAGMGDDFGFGERRANWNAFGDDRYRDWAIIVFGLLALGCGMLPALWYPQYIANELHLAASSNLAQARHEAKEFGEERRREIRRRVQENQESTNTKV